MKVVLLQDVAKLGRRFDVVEAPNGYAMNKLVPQRMAEPATPQTLKRIAALKEKQKTNASQSEAGFEEALALLKDQAIKVEVKANEQGHLFSAVSEADVVSALDAAGVTIDSSFIKFSEPIKSIGEHKIKLGYGEREEEVTILIAAKS